MNKPRFKESFIEAGGIRWRYRRGGSGPTVLLLHTLRTQLEYFDHVSALIENADVVIPDFPGHGESSAPKAAYTANFFTDSVAALIDELKLKKVIVVGESIGAVIGLGLAARAHPAIMGVIALNPYDYGNYGGIRRSSVFANLIFSAMLVPLLGSIVARSGLPPILKKVMEGGVQDRHKITPDFIRLLFRSGLNSGHAHAFRSLCLEWRSWIEARNSYTQIETPIWLAYSEADWSMPSECKSNRQLLPDARYIDLGPAGHFSSLEMPETIARLVTDAASPNA